jgi:DNA-binding response OmpR family regulator
LNFTPDRPIVSRKWKISLSEVTYNGIGFDLTTQETAFVHTLALARGAPVPHETIAARICNDSTFPEALARTVAFNVRSKIGPTPVATVRGKGYSWTGAPPWR